MSHDVTNSESPSSINSQKPKEITETKTDENTENNPGDIDLDLNDPSLAKAALLFQSGFRGLQARLKFKSKVRIRLLYHYQKLCLQFNFFLSLVFISLKKRNFDYFLFWYINMTVFFSFGSLFKTISISFDLRSEWILMSLICLW